MAGDARFEIFEGMNGYHWRLVGANGEKVAQSEAYTRKADARRAIGDVRAMLMEADLEVREV